LLDPLLELEDHHRLADLVDFLVDHQEGFQELHRLDLEDHRGEAGRQLASPPDSLVPLAVDLLAFSYRWDSKRRAKDRLVKDLRVQVEVSLLHSVDRNELHADETMLFC